MDSFKLLFDHNLSYRILKHLPKSFDESNHVYLLDLSEADDEKVWEYASANRYTIVRKDTDFFDKVSLKGFPPKVVWTRRGNCATKEMVDIFTSNIEKLSSFISDEENGILIIEENGIGRRKHLQNP